jgi:F-type H+-transporting ATPase subunit delta
MLKKGAEKITRKLAIALFERARDFSNSNLKDFSGLLGILAENIKNSAELRSALLNPSVSQENKLAILTDVLMQGAAFGNQPEQARGLFSAFLVSALEYDAVLLLNRVEDHFNKLVEQLNRLASLEVVSAFEFSKEEKEKLEARLEQELGLTPQVAWEIDKNLIGGAVVKLHDQILDSSVRGALDNLKEALL